MFSTLLELAGFAAIIAATYLAAGLVAALYVGAAVLLLIGYALDDERAVIGLRRVARPVRLRLALVRADREQRRRRRELAKAG